MFLLPCLLACQEHGQDHLQCLVLRPMEHMEAPASTLHQESILLGWGACLPAKLCDISGENMIQSEGAYL